MSKSMLENDDIKALLDSSLDDSVLITVSYKSSLLTACEHYKQRAGFRNRGIYIAQKILDFYEHEAKDLPKNPMLEESVSLFLMVVLYTLLEETNSKLFIGILKSESGLDFAEESKKFCASSIQVHKAYLVDASTSLRLEVNDLTAYIINKYPKQFIDFRPDPGMPNQTLAYFDDAMNLLISQGLINKNWEYLATIGQYIFCHRKEYDLSKVFGKAGNTHVGSTFKDWLVLILMRGLCTNPFSISDLECMLDIAQQQKILWKFMQTFLGEIGWMNAIEDKEPLYQLVVNRKFYSDLPEEDQKTSYLSCHQRIYSWFYDQHNLPIIKQLYEDLCKFFLNSSVITDWLCEVLGLAAGEQRKCIDIDLFLLNKLDSVLATEIAHAGIKPNIKLQHAFFEKTGHMLSLARIFNNSDLYAKWMEKFDTSTYEGSRAVCSYLGMAAYKAMDYKIFECTYLKFKTMVLNEEYKRQNIHDILKALFTDHVTDNSKDAIITTLVGYSGITIKQCGNSYRLTFSEKLNISTPPGKNPLFAKIMNQHTSLERNPFEFFHVTQQSAGETVVDASENQKEAGASNQPNK